MPRKSRRLAMEMEILRIILQLYNVAELIGCEQPTRSAVVGIGA